MNFHTQMVCKDCGSTVSMKDTERWVSLKCKCRCAIYYPSGHFAVIPKNVYLRNKEKSKEGDDDE